jgi:hypothetical protein
MAPKVAPAGGKQVEPNLNELIPLMLFDPRAAAKVKQALDLQGEKGWLREVWDYGRGDIYTNREQTIQISRMESYDITASVVQERPDFSVFARRTFEDTPLAAIVEQLRTGCAEDTAATLGIKANANRFGEYQWTDGERTIRFHTGVPGFNGVRIEMKHPPMAESWVETIGLRTPSAVDEPSVTDGRKGYWCGRRSPVVFDQPRLAVPEKRYWHPTAGMGWAIY